MASRACGVERKFSIFASFAWRVAAEAATSFCKSASETACCGAFVCVAADCAAAGTAAIASPIRTAVKLLCLNIINPPQLEHGLACRLEPALCSTPHRCARISRGLPRLVFFLRVLAACLQYSFLHFIDSGSSLFLLVCTRLSAPFSGNWRLL